MAVLEVLQYPHEILKKKCALIEKIDYRINQLINDMIESLHSFPGCVGIAAPQVGCSVQLIVVDASKHKKTTISHGLMILLNPVIRMQEGEVISGEGCLSLPDYTGNVKRAAKIKVSAQNRMGQPIEIETKGFEAIVFQHEIDHLNGILFVDRIISLKKDLFRRKSYKKRKE
jgi:peptide deformylase